MNEPAQAPVVPDPPKTFHKGCEELELSLSEGVMTRLRDHLKCLLTANQMMNLTAVRDPLVAWDRHILDSLTLLPHLNPGDSVIDIGSGGGLPGVILALVDPTRQVTLLESTRKKCRFLEKTAGHLGQGGISVTWARAEVAGYDPRFREQFDVATARGLGPLPTALECLAPFVRPGGHLIAMKGVQAESEWNCSATACEKLGIDLVSIVHPLPRTCPESALVIMQKPGVLSPEFPRRTGIPTKRPL